MEDSRIRDGKYTISVFGIHDLGPSHDLIALHNNLALETEIVNQILDGHKCSAIAVLMKVIFDDFVFDSKSDAWSTYFNRTIWEIDNCNLFFKTDILKLRDEFDKISVYYNEKPRTEITSGIIKNVKNLVN